MLTYPLGGFYLQAEVTSKAKRRIKQKLIPERYMKKITKRVMEDYFRESQESKRFVRLHQACLNTRTTFCRYQHLQNDDYRFGRS